MYYVQSKITPQIRLVRNCSIPQPARGSKSTWMKNLAIFFNPFPGGSCGPCVPADYDCYVNLLYLGNERERSKTSENMSGRVGTLSSPRKGRKKFTGRIREVLRRRYSSTRHGHLVLLSRAIRLHAALVSFEDEAFLKHSAPT